MQKYGIIKDGNLTVSDTQLEGYKPIEYARLPEFDQLTQAVIEDNIVDEGSYISVGTKIIEVVQDDGELEEPLPH